MDILQKFDELIESHEESNQYIRVDLMEMISIFKVVTPIAVPYEDTPGTLSDLPYAVLHNFFNHCPEEFPLYALRCLHRIVTKSVDDVDTKPHLMMMLHLTKMSGIDSAPYINRFEKMHIVPEDANTALWLQLAEKTIKHPNLNELINEVIKLSFGHGFAQRIDETNLIPVTVSLVATNEIELRGFSGINVIYVNSTYFKSVKYRLSLTQLPEKDNILVMDILTVVIHEYAHIRARQIANNCNHSTPTCLIQTVNESDPEFGRMIERALFSVSIDWIKSLEIRSGVIDYIDQFLKAVDTGEEIPRLNASPDLIARSGPILMHGGGGLDICVQQSIE